MGRWSEVYLKQFVLLLKQRLVAEPKGILVLLDGDCIVLGMPFPPEYLTFSILNFIPTADESIALPSDLRKQ